MTERPITVEVLKHLRGHLRGSVVQKHMDVGTKGWPDISVGMLDRASYIELKHRKVRESLKGINDPVQLSLCHQLGMVHNDRSWVVVYDDRPRHVTVWRPRALFAKLWPTVAGPGDWHTIGVKPLVLPLAEFLKADLHTLLEVHGAVTADEWSYAIPTYLVLNGLNR